MAIDDVLRNKKKKKKEEEKKKSSSQSINSILREDIAQKEEKDTYFQKGAYRDGYEKGDLSKSILASFDDIQHNFRTGVVGMGEKIVDAGATVVGGVGGLFSKDFKEDVGDFIEKDLYDSEKVADNWITKLLLGSHFDMAKGTANVFGADITEEDSFLGEKSDSLVQSGTEMLTTYGVQALTGGAVPWWLITGTTSLGANMEESLRDGATYDQAMMTAGVQTVGELLTEKLFGGSGLGEKGLINLEPLTKGIANKVVKTFADYGIDVLAEGTEEVVSQVVSNLATKIYKDESFKDVLLSEEAFEGYLDSFIGGAVIGGGMNVGNIASHVKNKTDYRTDLTANEQKILDQVVEEEIAEAEKNGKTLTKKEKNEIEQKWMTTLKRGEIDTDIIEKAFAEEDHNAYNELTKEADEYNSLLDIADKDMTARQRKRLAELEAKNTEQAYKDRLLDSRSKLSENLYNATKNDQYLQGTFAERGRRGEAFTVSEEEMKQYSDAEKKIVQKAIEYGEMNNTKKAHEFVQLVAKLCADKGLDFDFTNNEKLAQSGFAIEGKTINGFKQGNKITVNMQTNALEKVVGHEITHVLEGTDLYQALQDSVFAYAETKGVFKDLYDTAFENYKGVYKNMTEEKYAEAIRKEVTADLVGEYIFSDKEFYRNLSTKNQNVFEKVYSEIKYLLKSVTSGSDAEKQLLKAKKIFEDVYRDTKKNTSDKTQMSIDDIDIELDRIYEEMTLEEAEALIIDIEDLIKLPSKWGLEIEETKVSKPRYKGDTKTKGKVAKLTDERIEHLFNEYGASNPSYAKAYVTSIHPRDFLSLTLSDESLEKWDNATKQGTDAEYRPLDVEKLKNERQTPFLEVDTETGRVIGHEGRHRMRALLEAGVTEVPIAVIDINTKYSKQKESSMRLSSQEFYEGYVNDNFKTEVKNLIPLNKVNSNEIYSAYGGKGDIRYSISTEYDSMPKAKPSLDPTSAVLLKDQRSVREIRNDVMLQNNYSAEDVARVTEFFDEMGEFMKKAGMTYRYIGLDDVNDAKLSVTYDKKGNPKKIILSAMVRNGDYPVNFDFTSICKKRQSISLVVKELAKRQTEGKRTLDVVNLSPQSLWKINDALREAGLETACLGCFVESKRYNIQNFTTKATRMWNKIVDEVRAEQGIEGEAPFFNFAEGVDLDSVDYGEVDAIYKEYNTKSGRTSPEKRMRALLESGGETFQKYLNPSDLMTPEGIQAIKSLSSKKNNLYGILQGVYGQASPKEVMGFSPYNSEVALLPKTKNRKPIVEYLKTIGGVRMQSFSDFLIANVYDYMQMVADLSARHLPAHAYTKELAFAKIFGMTGIKINMSVMFDIDGNLPDAYAGLQFVEDANGTEIYNGVRGRFEYLVADQKRSDEQFKKTGVRPFVQSIPFEEAVALQNDPRYSKNVGIIGVGYSDKHIEMMLGDDRIRYVIPYHASSLPAIIKDATRIRKATDYTDCQNTRHLKKIVDSQGNEISFDALKNQYGIDVYRVLQEMVAKNEAQIETSGEKALAGHGAFDLYRDLETTKNPKQTANNYLQYCADNNLMPIFEQFTGHENYYKLLYDFDPYDSVSGEYSPQTEVANIYDGYDASKGQFSTEKLQQMIDDEMSIQNENNRYRAEKIPSIVDGLIEQLGTKEDVQLSMTDDSQPLAPRNPNLTYQEDIALEKPIAPTVETPKAPTPRPIAPSRMPMVEDDMFEEDDLVGEIPQTEERMMFEDGTSQPISPTKREVHGMDVIPPPQENEVRGMKIQKGMTLPTSETIQPKAPTETKSGKELRRWAETSTESEVVGGAIKLEDLDQDIIHYEPISNKSTLQKANTKLDTFKSYEDAMTYFNSQMSANKVELVDLVMGERLLQEAIKRKDTKNAGELIQNIAVLGTELGRKVQALSIIQRLTPEGQLKMIQKTVDRGKVKGDKIFKDVELTDDMRQEILDAYNEDGSYDQDKLNSAIESVKQQLADQMGVTGMERVNAWRMLSMLGNPKTHIRNVVSNMTMFAVREAKDSLARTIETGVDATSKMIAPINPKLAEKMKLDTRTKTWQRASDDVKTFSQQSTKDAEALLKSEHRGTDSTTLADIKAKRKVFGNSILQKVYGLNSDLLQGEDTFFKRPVYRRSLQEFLTANGIKTQEDINNNIELVEKGKKYAMEQSLIATFQQESWLAETIGRIERKNVGTQIAVGSVLPFKKTPINIAKTGLAYSPLGFTKTLAYDMPKVMKGEMEASQLIDNISQATTGTALMLTGYLLSSIGMLNGGGEDDREGEYDYQLGEQSYSLNLGGKSYSLSWLTPASMPLFIGANFYEMFSKGERMNFDATVDALASTLDPMSEMSFLSSLDTALSSYDSGTQKFMGIFENAGQSYVSQFAPTLFSQVAQVTDDTKRSTTASADSDARMVEQTIRKLMYKIPGLRQMLEPTIDIHGNEVKQSDNALVRGLESFIAPYNTKDYIADDVDMEIKELYAQTGDSGVIPSVPSSKVNYKGETYKMSAKEFTEYKKTYGQTANDYLGRLFNTSTYQGATIEEKNDMVNKVYDYARDVAHKEYLGKEGIQYTNTTEDNVPVYKENKIKGAIEHDMTVDEYDLYSTDKGKYGISQCVGGFDSYTAYKNELKDIHGDKNIYGKTISGSKKKKVLSYINGLNADYYTKIILFKAEYPSDDTYNADIIDYVNGRSDFTYQEKVDTLTELGFTVLTNGTVRWD